MAMPRKLTLETIDRICQAYAAGVKATAIASQLRLSPSVVFRAIANPAEERRLAQATIERRAAQQRASRQRLRSLERELQEHQRQLPRPSRDETPFRVRPVAKHLCPGCGGLVVRFPCVLCTCRGEAASPLRDVPAAWRQRRIDTGVIPYIRSSELIGPVLDVAWS